MSPGSVCWSKSTLPKAPCLAGTFPLNFLQSFPMFPHWFLVYQKGSRPRSGNLAIVSEPADSSPLPPPLTSSCGYPWRPSCLVLPAQPSLQGWQLACFLCVAHLPPALPSKTLLWLLSHHCPIDSWQHPSTPGGVLIILILQARK